VLVLYCGMQTFVLSSTVNILHLDVGVASPPVQCAVLGSTIQGYKKIRMCATEGIKDGERTRRHDL